MPCLLILLAGLLGACAVNPVTGERQLAFISESQEIALGQQGAAEVRQSMALVQDQALQDYVERLGLKLAAASERPDLPWSFAVVDDPVPNAFALPGGPVFVTRGLLTLMDSEAELVSVLGHEIGHITARHSVAQMSRAQLAQLGLGLGTIFVPEVRPYGELASSGLSLLLLKYGRDAERQADTLGFKYAQSQGYDTREMADVFAALQQSAELAGQSAIPNWMASHPAPQERIEAVQRRLAEQSGHGLDSTVGRADFLGQIDGLAYGENPRQGFFREGVFYHPELRFRFQLPEGWQRQNLAQAVVGLSPQQNAAFQFSLATAPSAEQAFRQFASQQGLQVGRPDATEVNGIPAMSAVFQAQTQQGITTGIATFYELEQRVYQLVTYARIDSFDSYRPTFEAIIESFAAVDDPDILEVQPATVEIVELPRAMSFNEFVRWSDSTINADQLALINQIQSRSDIIPAGTLLKQVKGGVGGGA